MRKSELSFLDLQGYDIAQSYDGLYSAAMFQPRVIAGLGAVGIVVQSHWFFLALSAVLFWSAIVPTRNPFDTLSNLLIAYPRGLPVLPTAAAPRRFAMGMAATVALVIGGALLGHALWMAWTFEAMLFGAAMAVVMTRSCAGANLYHALRRRGERAAAPSTGMSKA